MHSENSIFEILETVDEEYIDGKQDELNKRMGLALLGYNAGLYKWHMLDNSAYYSPQWIKMLRYEENELPAHLSTWQERVHNDDIEVIMINVQNTINAQKKNIETVHRLKHKNGQWIWILGRGLIRYNEDNKPYSMVGIHTNITQQKEEQLKSEHKTQIIEQINDFVVSTDFNGNIVSSNKAVEKLLGYKADEIIGKNVAIFHCEEDIPNIVNNIAKLLTTGEFSEDLYIVKKNKQLLYVSISFSLLKDSGGEPIYIIATGSDITERKKVEEEIKYLNNNLQKEVQNQLEELRKKDEQLLQQSKLAQMGDMISMIAHQWRQPLNAISATGINLSLLSSMNILDNAKLQEISEFIQGQTQKMSSTIDTFINFVKPSRESKPFKLIQSIDAIIQIMGTQLVNHDIKVDIEIINEEISIDGHEDLLEQVIINLLSNSRDAFDELDKDNKFINIIISKKDKIPTITIEDNAGGDTTRYTR